MGCFQGWLLSFDWDVFTLSSEFLCPLLYCIPFVLNLVFVLISLILYSVGEQTSNFLRQLMKVQISISFMSENVFTLPSYLRVWMEGMFPHNEKDIAPRSSSFIITAEKSSFLIIQIYLLFFFYFECTGYCIYCFCRGILYWRASIWVAFLELCQTLWRNSCLVAKSCPTLCSSTDCSLLGSPVHGCPS